MAPVPGTGCGYFPRLDLGRRRVSRISDNVVPERCGTCGYLRHPAWSCERRFSKPTCKQCGNPLKSWTPRLIIECARAFAREHGRPPRSDEWRKATPDNPAPTTISTHFGSWNRMLAAAGLSIREGRSNPVWSKDT